MNLAIPEFSFVVLIGPCGSGKSTFARKHFKPTEILSSDFCRGLVSDDETDQTATEAAFEILHCVAAKRLAAGRLTVIDATNVQAQARKPLAALAREYHCLPVAIVFNLPEKICHERNHQRPDRSFGPHVVRQQCQQMRRSLTDLRREGFIHVFTFSSPEEVEDATVVRQPLWTNLRHEHGPFDIVGDVHGCLGELEELLRKLGCQVDAVSENADQRNYQVKPPAGRKLIFLGDLVDRGPDTPGVLRLVMGMAESGAALCLPGNHDIKLLKNLRWRQVQVSHGLAATLDQLGRVPPEFKDRVAVFLDSLVSHYVFDEGKLVVAHAGMKEEMQGRASRRVRDFALYGETTGETDEFGLPVRLNWAEEYRGKAMVVYGHTPVAEPQWLNRTINIDTGCVFGGNLTALRYPERELVSVPAAKAYYEPARPFLNEAGQSAALLATRGHEDLLDIDDVLGKRIISTRLSHDVTIREENALAALEVMSRFAADPRWLVYLPPTMSPCETSKENGLLEHPAEAFAHYRHQGVAEVICEEKHMGSRAVVVVCRDEEAVRKRFGITGDGIGICYTRTGRRFYDNQALEAAILNQVRGALDAARFWDEHRTDWVCLDCELMPWSAKALELLRQQYAAVGAASRSALAQALEALEQAAQTGVEVSSLLKRYQRRAEMVQRYVEAYRRYCWEVNSVSDLKLAPFHVMAMEGAVHADKNHLWHMQEISKLCQPGEKLSALLHPTVYKVVDLTDPASEREGILWWEELTTRGGEGIVVKPLSFVARGLRGLAQPAIKCRGREYLRIIYGPEYTEPKHLERLRTRGLATKRSLALREFALGIEALERFVRREPLYRVHECVFGVLALESEPVDPRL